MRYIRSYSPYWRPSRFQTNGLGCFPGLFRRQNLGPTDNTWRGGSQQKCERIGPGPSECPLRAFSAPPSAVFHSLSYSELNMPELAEEAPTCQNGHCCESPDHPPPDVGYPSAGLIWWRGCHLPYRRSQRVTRCLRVRKFRRAGWYWNESLHQPLNRVWRCMQADVCVPWSNAAAYWPCTVRETWIQ